MRRKQSAQVIAITGASGSGKSTLATALLEYLSTSQTLPTPAVLSVDAYYRDLSDLTFEQRDAVNFDHPDAIEFELFDTHLSQLRMGQDVAAPIYDFSRHTRADGTEPVAAAELVLLEGVLLGAWSQLRARVDLLIFVDAPLELCLQRRIERDVAERGRSEASVREFWNDRALPAFLTWGAHVLDSADLVVSGEQPVEKSLQEVLALL